MNTYLFAAGALAFFVGLVHSVLGEVLIFKRMRVGGIVPSNGGKVIGPGHVQILWASWHLVTALGWLMAATLLWLGITPASADTLSFLLTAIGVACVCSAALVAGATRGRHPGWAGLLGVAVLTWLGR